ncbi:MAG: MTH938/NDUFAF3 family protein, partial [Kordiimonas sp.]
AESLSDLTEAHFDEVFSAVDKPEILFVGTGSKMQLLPAPIRKFLEAKGLMPDVMDTGAAARTLNVLRMEDRRVAALLLQVE